MKKTKQLAAVLLSLVMLLALAIPASAAGPYSITIHNDKPGHTYEAYQIFAGDVSSDDLQQGNAEGPILSNITWGNGVNGTALLAALQKANAEKYGECTTAAEVAEALGAENATAADAAAFADIAALHLAAVAGTATAPNGDGNYVIKNLAAGYYLVKDKDHTLDGTADTATEYIVQVLGNVAMAPKSSDIPTLEKKVYDEEFAQGDQARTYGLGYNDVADWDIGDNVPFKLIASVPDADEIAAYDTYTYTFHDTLDASLDLLRKGDQDQTTFEIYFVDNLTIDPRDQGFQYLAADQYTPVVNGNSFTITLGNLKTLMVTTADGEQKPATDYNYIVIFYDAVLNENAKIGLPGNENTAYLEFSNNPNGNGTGRTAEDTVIVFTYELDGTKVDGANVDTKLAGAQFVLLNGGKTRAARVDETGKLTGWVEPDEINPAVEGNNDYERMGNLTNEDFARAGLAITSDADGAFKIAGLDDGTYFLREIQAPNGYNLLEGDVQLVITADTANGQEWDGDPETALTALNMTITVGGAEEAPTEVEGVLVGGTVGITVENNQGATLPETGGMGTTLFYIIGGLLVVGAGILLVVRIRMRSHNE